MVAFGEPVQSFGDRETLTSLDLQIRQSIRMGELIRTLDDQIATSAEFIQKTAGANHGPEGRHSGASGDDFGLMQGFGMDSGQGGFF